jgi:membrane-bound ClpP family serine protease
LVEILKQLLRKYASRFVKESKSASLDLVKIKAVGVYLKIVDSVRKSVLCGFMLLLALLLLVIGFVALHIGVFIVFDLSMRTIGIVTLCLGIIYFIIPLIVILKLTSERTWMEMSKGSKLMKDVLSPQRRE